MSIWVDLLRWAHGVGAAVLLGTGAGIAFFMVMAHRTRDTVSIAHVASTVVIADMVFTATAVVLQPVTGIALAHMLGWSLVTPWLVASIALYVFTGLCWLPVLWIQIRLRDLARAAAAQDEPLPQAYHRLFRMWLALGVPAFGSVLAILWLMIIKPDLG